MKKHVLCGLLACVASALLPAQKKTDAQPELTLKPARKIEFETTEGTAMSVDVSPDGKTVIFDLLGDLYTMPMAGGRARALTKGMAWDRQPRFSPDGKHIAFISDRSGSENVWVMDITGAQAQNLTRGRNFYPLSQPLWTADGKAILVGIDRQLWRYDLTGGEGLLLSDDDYISGGSALPKDGGIVFIGKKGVILRQEKAKQPDSVLVSCEKVWNCSSSLVSPDGRWLVYARQAQSAAMGVTLYLQALQSTSGEAIQGRVLAPFVETVEQQFLPAGMFVPGYAFTPDSRSLVVAMQGKLQKIDLASRQAKIIPFEAQVHAELAPLASFPRRLDDADLQIKQIRGLQSSPDGKNWIFTALGKIWRVDGEGRPYRLTDGALRESDPVYSPDGKWIAYVTWSDITGGQLWKLPVMGGNPVLLSTESGAYLAPRWLPDGSALVFFYNEHQKEVIKRVTEHNRDSYKNNEATKRQVEYYPARIAAAGGPIARIGNTRAMIENVWSAIVPGLTVGADGKQIYFLTPLQYGKNPYDALSALVSMEIDSGVSRHLLAFTASIAGRDFVEPYDHQVLVSPDKRWIAVWSNFGLRVLPLPTAEKPVEVINLLDMDKYQDFIPVSSSSLSPGWTTRGSQLQWIWDSRIYQVPVKQFASPGTLHPSWVNTVDLRVPRVVSKDSVLLKGARLITMKRSKKSLSSACRHPVDGGIIDRGDILIAGRRIAAVGITGSFKVPAGTRVLDMSGMTVIPGLVDLLGNNTGSRNFYINPQHNSVYDANLAYGVTTFYASVVGFGAGVSSEMVETGELRGPRAILSFLAGNPEGAFDQNDRSAIERALPVFTQYGYPYFKTYEGKQPRYERQWISEIATRQPISLSFHQHDHFRVLQNVLDGYGMIVHTTGGVLYRDVIELLARSGTAYNMAAGYDVMTAQDIWDASHRNFWWDEDIDTAVENVSSLDSLPAQLTDRIKQPWREVSKLLCAGVIVGTGTDTYNLSGLSMQSQLWSMAESGDLKPLEILQIGTLNNIRALGLEADLGSIEVGKVADLVILEKNPLDNIRNTASTRYVLKDGIVYDADTLNVVTERVLR